MKKWIYRIVFVSMFLSFATCAFGQHINLVGSAQYFEVGIEQDGKLVPIENHQVILRKKSFMIVLYLKQPDGILINASFTPESFESVQAGRPLKDIIGFSDLGMAEEAFNPKALLIVSSHAPHYWYYENDANHRFNEVQREGNIFICRRIVANVMYRDTTKQFVPVRAISEDTLYLVFMKTVWTKDFSQQIEKQREYVKVIFR